MIEIIGTALYQWDTGRSVKVTGIEADHIHFANKGDSKAVVMELSDSQAKIPDYLLQTGKQICAYAVENGNTVESKVFCVTQRERPEHYVYEEDQRNFVYELIQSAEDATEAANQAAEAAALATQSADGATNRATAAAEGAEKASTDANKAAAYAVKTAKSLMVVGEARGTVIPLDDAIEQSFVDLRVFGKTTQDGTPTPDAPVELVSVGEDGSTVITAAGKNLLPPSSATSGFRGNGDGTYTMLDVSLNANTIGLLTLVAGNQYTLSATRVLGNGLLPCLIFRKEDGVNLKTNYIDPSVPLTITPTETETIRIVLQSESSKGNCTIGDMFAIQLEIGSTATTYEPYKGQTLTIATPNGLPGIPVSSGGNYTDASGQQWICDEIDLTRGVYIQRIARKVFNGTEEGWGQTNDQRAFKIAWNGVNGGWLKNEAIASHFVCSAANAYIAVSGYFAIDNNGLCYFAYDKATLDEFKSWLADNNVTVLCPLATPIEMPLTEEELAAYAALRTYKDSTTVSNDAGAYMELEYVMDAKKYIDGLFAGTIIPATVE